MDLVPESDVEGAEPVDGVTLKILAAGEQMNVQHFRIEPGATVPAHSHPHEQAGYLFRGELVFLLDDGEQVVRAGESYNLAGEETHGVENRGDEPVEGIDIFSPPRTDPDWAE